MENLYSAPQADLNQIPTSSVGDETYAPQMFSFSGRIGRLRYMAYQTTAIVLIYLVFGILGAVVVGMSANASPNFAAIGVIGILAMLLGFAAILIVTLTYVKRRLNDCGVSGWWGILVFVPLVNLLVSLFLVFAPGTQGANDYGPAPEKNSVLVVIGALFFPLIMIIGILAAVALPAYKDYTDRAKAAQSQSVAP